MVPHTDFRPLSSAPILGQPSLPSGPGRGPGLVPEIGCASRAVAGKHNEDAAAWARAGPAELASHGFIMAVADGMGTDGSGRHAARVAAGMVVADYYGTRSDWPVARGLERIIHACNDWFHAQNRRRLDSDGSLACLSVLVLRGTRYFIAHVGDTRVYRLRGGRLEQLTTDHVWPRHDMRHVPKRAIGLDSHVVIDFGEGDYRPGDVFVLATDGVWEVLGDEALSRTLAEPTGLQDAADRVVGRAIERQRVYMGRNDATVLLAGIRED